MGKAKRKGQTVYTNHHDSPRRKSGNIVRRSHSQTVPKKPETLKPQARQATARAVTRSRVPFNGSDRVLCIGEGDFSFALSLAERHNVKHIIATCYDDEKTLHKKYPQAQQIIFRLLSANPDQATRFLNEDEESEWPGLSPAPSKPDSDLPNTTGGDARCTALQPQRNSAQTRLRSVHYAINGTKLSSIHSKLLRTHSPFTKIVFNFPHVGGLSTDMNRQVRANQELLVGFFKAAIPLLASLERPVQIERSHGEDVDQDDLDAGNDEGNLSELSFENREMAIITKGQILVTLFEGEPYTLWNVRDLARHSGLKVVESFRFPWEAYPGYTHARTVGEITTGKDRSAEGKRKGAWRGEDRDARCFVFEVKEGEDINRDATGTKANDVDAGTRKRKRKGMTSGTDNDSESD